VIHRDVKPENILLANGRPLVADFGIALALEESAERLTHTGMVVGTPRYMAPEQVMGDGFDARGDLFAAGAILFEMLAGRPAFAGRTVVEVLHATV
jgi:serine/threonine-protein kinase